MSLSWIEAAVLVLLDLSTAFDTIDDSTLLSCLKDWFGVGGSILKWLSSYLTERYQSVKIGSTLSDLQKLLFGVPQGSVLSPLHFSLYTSPRSTLIGKHKGLKFHFYADDTQLYAHLSHMNASAALMSWTDVFKMSKNGCWLANSNSILIKLSLFFLAPRNREKG